MNQDPDARTTGAVVRWTGQPRTLPPRDRFDQAASLHGQFQRYKLALQKRWWLPFLTLALIGGPAVFYAFLKPPTYQSQAIMWMTGKLNLPEGRLYSEELSTYMGTQAELIKGPTVRLRAFQKLRVKFPAVAPDGTNSVPDPFPFTLNVKNSLKSSTLELRAIGPWPEATRAYLDEVMQEYINFKRESRKQTSANALSTITDQLKEIETQLQEQQARLTAFQASNNIAFLTESGLSAGSHLAKLNELLSDLRTEYRLLELLSPEQWKDIGTTPRGTSTGIAVPGEKAAHAVASASPASQPGYYQALQQLQLLKVKRDEFARVLRPTHSKMIKLNQEIAGLDQLLSALKQEGEQQALAQMVNRKKSLDLQIQNLENQYRTWETNAVEASRKLAEHDYLKQQVQRFQGLHDRFLSLVQTVDLNKELDQETVSPLPPPRRPGQA